MTASQGAGGGSTPGSQTSRLPRGGACELHDLIGQTVTVMVVQAGEARRQLDRDVEQAHRSLVTIEAIGRTALDELDRMLGTLRKSDPDLAPQPRLSDIEELIGRFEGSGLDVSIPSSTRASRECWWRPSYERGVLVADAQLASLTERERSAAPRGSG